MLLQPLGHLSVSLESTVYRLVAEPASARCDTNCDRPMNLARLLTAIWSRRRPRQHNRPTPPSSIERERVSLGHRTQVHFGHASCSGDVALPAGTPNTGPRPGPPPLARRPRPSASSARAGTWWSGRGRECHFALSECHADYGHRPEKRLQFQQARDHWYEILERRYSAPAIEQVLKLEDLATKNDVGALRDTVRAVQNADDRARTRQHERI